MSIAIDQPVSERTPLTARLREKFRNATAPRGQNLDLPKLAWWEKAYNLILTGVGAFAGKGLVFGFYILVFEAVYKLFGHKFSLANWWNNWPVLTQLPARLSAVHVGGPGGLGTWFVSRWPFIQDVYFKSWPIGVLDVAIIALILNRGAGVKDNWFDRLTKSLYDHGLKFIPSRLDEKATTGLQYTFLPVTMLFFGIPGAILGSLILFGLPIVIHWAWLHTLFGNTAFEIAVLGVLSHLFWASRITMKPAHDVQRFFLQKRAAAAQVIKDCQMTFRDAVLTSARRVGLRPGDTLTPEEQPALETVMITSTSSGRRVQPQKWYPPFFVHLYDAALLKVVAGEANLKKYTDATKVLIPVFTAIGVIVALFGLYEAYIVPAHGGWVP